MYCTVLRTKFLFPDGQLVSHALVVAMMAQAVLAGANTQPARVSAPWSAV